MLRELYDDEVVTEAAEEAQARQVPDWELGHVRAMLAQVHRLKAEQEKMREVKQAVLATYQDQLHALQERELRVRDSLRVYIGTVNGGEPVKFPDVGSAYLQERKPRLVVADAEKAQQAHGHHFQRIEFDLQAYKAWAEKQLEEVGELPEGCELEPAYSTLVVR